MRHDTVLPDRSVWMGNVVAEPIVAGTSLRKAALARCIGGERHGRHGAEPEPADNHRDYRTDRAGGCADLRHLSHAPAARAAAETAAGNRIRPRQELNPAETGTIGPAARGKNANKFI